MGLRVPEFAVIEISDLDIPMVGRGVMGRGPAFISRSIDDAFVADGTDAPLKRLIDPGAPSRMVIFDTWIRNYDRWPPEGSIFEPNRDNLLFTSQGRKLDLVAIDHSHCFVEGRLEDQIGEEITREDVRVHGNFPEFASFITEPDVMSAVARLREISPRDVREIVDSVPVAWGVSAATRNEWFNVICYRAALVANTAPDQLLRQNRLDLEEGGEGE